MKILDIGHGFCRSTQIEIKKIRVYPRLSVSYLLACQNNEKRFVWSTNLMSHDIAELKIIARNIRGKIIEMSHKTGTAHLGSSLSCVDILIALYWNVLPINPDKPSAQDRDRFILSKGHAASALYATLAFKGFFPMNILDTFAMPGSRLEEHPGPNCISGVEAATGSLGHGLSMGVGMALAGRIQAYNNRIFVLLSDGECNEGSVWEAAMFAAAQRIERLTAIMLLS